MTHGKSQAVGGLMLFAGLAVSTAQASTLSIVYGFKGGVDGQGPLSGPTYHDGKLYGTTYGGGAAGFGTVFAIDLAKTSKTTLYSFPAQVSAPINPGAPLIFRRGYLYGTTDALYQNQDDYAGAVFKVDATTGLETTLYSLPGLQLDPNVHPMVNFVGNKLYGTVATIAGGALYRVGQKSGTATTVYSFGQYGSDGQGPDSNVVEAGKFVYGTTFTGGNRNCGVFYSIDRATGAETVVHYFGLGIDGYVPGGPLAYVNGIFYGATSGGNAGGGSVYALNPQTGDEAVLIHGGSPTGVTYHAGWLYVTDTGSIYRLNIASGATEVLAKLAAPAPGLVYHGGMFYGAATAANGGNGEIFALKP